MEIILEEIVFYEYWEPNLKKLLAETATTAGLFI